MDHATLVGFDIAAGDRVIEALEEAGYKISVALWTVLGEYGDARLVIASPTFDQMSGLKANMQLVTALDRAKVDFAQLPPVMVLKMKDPFIRGIRQLFGGSRNSGFRLSRVIGGHYVEQIYFYRVSKNSSLSIKEPMSQLQRVKRA